MLKDQQEYGFILLVLNGKRTIRINGNKELNLSKGSIVYIPPESAYDIDILDKGDKNCGLNCLYCNE